MGKSKTGIKAVVLESPKSLVENYFIKGGVKFPDFEMSETVTEQDAEVDSIMEWCVNWLRAAEAIEDRELWVSECFIEERMGHIVTMLEQAGY